MRVTYNPHIFDMPNIDMAKQIILTPEAGVETTERWDLETPYVAQLIGEVLQLQPGQLILDYGCGIGRIAKELIARYEVRVLGVDISPNMRAYAPGYVGSPRFSAVSNEVLHGLVDNGLRVDAAFCVWVLQHCVKPGDDIEILRQVLKPGGGLFVMNNEHRAVPTLEVAWANDEVSIRDLLRAAFEPAQEGRPELGPVVPAMALQTFWATYSKLR